MKKRWLISYRLDDGKIQYAGADASTPQAVINKLTRQFATSHAYHMGRTLHILQIEALTDDGLAEIECARENCDRLHKELENLRGYFPEGSKAAGIIAQASYLIWNTSWQYFNKIEEATCK